MARFGWDDDVAALLDQFQRRADRPVAGNVQAGLLLNQHDQDMRFGLGQAASNLRETSELRTMARRMPAAAGHEQRRSRPHHAAIERSRAEHARQTKTKVRSRSADAPASSPSAFAPQEFNGWLVLQP